MTCLGLFSHVWDFSHIQVLDLDNTLIHAYPNLPPLDAYLMFKRENEFQMVTPDCKDLLVKNPNFKSLENNIIQDELGKTFSTTSDRIPEFIIPHYFESSTPEIEESIRRWESWVIYLDRYVASPQDIARLNLEPLKNAYRKIRWINVTMGNGTRNNFT